MCYSCKTSLVVAEVIVVSPDAAEFFDLSGADGLGDAARLSLGNGLAGLLGGLSGDEGLLLEIQRPSGENQEMRLR